MKRIEFLKVSFLLIAALFFNACSKTQAVSETKTPPKTPAVNDTIRFLENRIKQNPEDFIAHNKLAAQYLQRLRETGDQIFLGLARRSVNASLEILPAEQNKQALALLAQVEFSSHDFSSAREHAAQLIKLEPNKGYPYQIFGDALLELGNYDEAKNAFRQMENLSGFQPLTLAAFEQRLARLAFLEGDHSKAKRHLSNALKIVLKMPNPPAETLAWCRWQLGETAFSSGDYKNAEKYYTEALAAFPNYAPTLASLGRVRAAQDDLTGAIVQYEKAVKILPDPIFVAALGDLYKLAGREDDARRQFELVEQIGNLSASSGTLYNRGLALFYANHDLKLTEAYNLAAKEYEIRRDIYGADALAWTAFKAGKLDEAQTAIKEALRLGTRDAQIFYHAGMIFKAAGDKSAAENYLKQAVKLNPQFDPLQSVAAKKALSEN